jgi:hypothetical protein
VERLLSRVDPGRIFEPFVDRHKRTIKQYVMELGERGILDELIDDESDPTRDLTAVSMGQYRSNTKSAASGAENENEEMNLGHSNISDGTVLQAAEAIEGGSAAPASHDSTITIQNVAIISCITETDVPDVDVDE